MPEISRFYGIVLAMFWRDHLPPHFHAYYAGHEAEIGLDGTLLAVPFRDPCHTDAQTGGDRSDESRRHYGPACSCAEPASRGQLLLAGNCTHPESDNGSILAEKSGFPNPSNRTGLPRDPDQNRLSE
ncbi:MAG: DUF4160 domain-containing protein [Acidithiobacillus ferriphilus]